MSDRVVIVGNGVAGYACAARLARNGHRPLLIGPGLPVDRPPLTKTALVKGEPVLLADAARLHERGIETLDAFVDEADLRARRVVAGGAEIHASAIVLATGLSYRPPAIPGLDVAHVNATPGGMRRLVADLGQGARRVAVLGGGLIGVETAATLATLGHRVTVLDLVDRPLDRLHDPLPGLAGATLEELGIGFLGGAAVEAVEAGASGLAVRTATGTADVDVVVAAMGGRLVSPPGLELDGPIAVDGDMRISGFDGVYAVGDLAVVPHARFGPMRFPHWDMAIGMGERAADAICGLEGELDRLPYWWSDIGPRRLAEVGWAGAAVSWAAEDGLHVGRDASSEVVAVLVVDEPRRLREARALVQS